ncbi:hypothetical protein [Blastococcus haudaquaticus]|uniref:Uncharacterized protein n=1 Tax=Blastococcus haudaquaticus TaxID=1938745 RepID=A0A286H179_9ACTN|nr:hypothetical protein [Blastococcus haudaquaticus]SOE01482.1 hypothetical protein SAMN06272739_3192 [Blastococcus haudaquaticus]
MTATLHATSTYATSAAHLPGAARLSHAVARPVVDGLDQSVCGVLVTVRAGQDWAAPSGAGRCEECTRIAG